MYYPMEVRYKSKNMGIIPNRKQALHDTLVIKLIESKIEETFNKWRLKMAKLIDPPKWLVIPLKGG
jgi:hypothetical protein